MTDPYSSTEYSQAQIQMQQLALQQQQLDLQRQQQQLQRQLEEQQQKMQQASDDKNQKTEKNQNDDHGKDDKESDGKEKDGDEEKKTDPADAKKRKRRILVILGIVLLLALVVGILVFLHTRHFEKSDDAFIDGHISNVAPQIAGSVVRLLIKDNQQVKAGQLLFEIDPRDAEVNLKQAQAQALQAAAQIDTAAAKLEKSSNDLQRYRQTDVRAVSRQQIDAAKAQADSDAASLEAAKASLAAAQAEVANAKLQLSYTQVKAPQDGRVTQRKVELGNYLKLGDVALAIVSDDLWVTANFKETQLDYMKIGQHVDIHVDAYPDAEITGHVESLQAGSGSVFSSLPAENATGNYVKIVQRVPVKIVIDKIEHDDDRQIRLAPGLSVEPRVTVR